nr:hypothetical protein GCM10020185_82940 [Pseudomonas brassicacearum subsp. brassicacearum]
MLFDRSWYNRAGVEQVMGFCTADQYEEFFRTVPEFERMLARSGIQLIKYWFSISDQEQHLRFLSRIHDPLKQWKLSPMDLESRRRWEAYTKAKEIMLERTHIAEAPWWVVHADDKKKRPGSIASITCLGKCPMKRWKCRPSNCRSEYDSKTTPAVRRHRSSSCLGSIKASQAGTPGTAPPTSTAH